MNSLLREHPANGPSPPTPINSDPEHVGRDGRDLTPRGDALHCSQANQKHQAQHLSHPQKVRCQNLQQWDPHDFRSFYPVNWPKTCPRAQSSDGLPHVAPGSSSPGGPPAADLDATEKPSEGQRRHVGTEEKRMAHKKYGWCTWKDPPLHDPTQETLKRSDKETWTGRDKQDATTQKHSRLPHALWHNPVCLEAFPCRLKLRCCPNMFLPQQLKAWGPSPDRLRGGPGRP